MPWAKGSGNGALFVFIKSLSQSTTVASAKIELDKLDKRTFHEVTRNG